MSYLEDSRAPGEHGRRCSGDRTCRLNREAPMRARASGRCGAEQKRRRALGPGAMEAALSRGLGVKGRGS